MLLVPNRVCSDGWVVAAPYALVQPRRCLQDFIPDLLADELCGACLVLPLAQKQLAQEGVQGLLLTTQLLTSAGVLLLQCAQKPLEHERSASGRILLGGGRNEYGGMFGPVGGELGERRRGQNEGGRGHSREIAIEGRDRLSLSACVLSANRMCTVPLGSYPTNPLPPGAQQTLLSRPCCIVLCVNVAFKKVESNKEWTESQFRAVCGVVVTTKAAGSLVGQVRDT